GSIRHGNFGTGSGEELGASGTSINFSPVVYTCGGSGLQGFKRAKAVLGSRSGSVFSTFLQSPLSFNRKEYYVGVAQRCTHKQSVDLFPSPFGVLSRQGDFEM